MNQVIILIAVTFVVLLIVSFLVNIVRLTYYYRKDQEFYKKRIEELEEEIEELQYEQQKYL